MSQNDNNDTFGDNLEAQFSQRVGASKHFFSSGISGRFTPRASHHYLMMISKLPCPGTQGQKLAFSAEMQIQTHDNIALLSEVGVEMFGRVCQCWSEIIHCEELHLIAQ